MIVIVTVMPSARAADAADRPPGVVHTRDSRGNIGTIAFTDIPAASRILAASPEPCKGTATKNVNYNANHVPFPDGHFEPLTLETAGTWRWDDATTDYQTLLDTFGPNFELKYLLYPA